MLSILLLPNRIIRTSWKEITINSVFRIQRNCRVELSLVAQVTKSLNKHVEVESIMPLINSAQCYQAKQMGFQKRLPWKRQSTISNLWRNSLRKLKLSLERKNDWILSVFLCLFFDGNPPILWFAKWILGDLLPAGGEYACL